MDVQLEQIWEEIESWDSVHRNPALGSYLNDAAPDEVVSGLNRQLGVELPADFLDSLRRHDGTAGWTTEFHSGSFYSSTEMPGKLEDMRGIAQDLLDAEGADGVSVDMTLTPTGLVKNVFWSAGWIPFHGTDWSETCFDFDPAEGGAVAQIIEVDWEGSWVRGVAGNYADFLRLCAEGLPVEPAP